MISFACSHCHRPLAVEAELAGKTSPCPECGESLVVPPPPEATHEFAPSTVATPPGGSDVPSSQRDQPGRHLYEFLAPAEGPDELGRLGPYRVLQVLGAGGMGVVFLAEDPALKRKVALKAMLPALAVSNSARKRFLREA